MAKFIICWRGMPRRKWSGVDVSNHFVKPNIANVIGVVKPVGRIVFAEGVKILRIMSRTGFQRKVSHISVSH